MSKAAQVISLLTSVSGAPIISERLSGEAGIIPGMLVAESAGTVSKHSTLNALAPKLFAQTNMPVGGTIDTAYASGETLRYGAYHAGQQVNALLPAAAAAIADGAPLTSNGDGTLKIGTAANAIAYAMEAVDNSGGGTTVRIKARIA
jgi:hypothetical protein